MSMEMKSYVVLSTIVDATIKENMPDVDFLLFKTIAENEQYIAQTPIRADIFYFTSETLKPTDTSGLNQLKRIFNNAFFNSKSIQIICPEDFKVQTIEYINAQLPVKIEINKGSLQRAFIYTLIEGTIANDAMTEQHVVNLRVNRSQFVELQRKREILAEKTAEEMNLLDEKYISDEEALQGVPEEDFFLPNIPRSEEPLETINICGIENKERRIFVFLLAQYLALKGKVIFFESDFQYLELSDLIARSALELKKIRLKDLIENTEQILAEIKLTPKNLIFIYSDSREVISYDFIYNLLYINLNGYANYILVERSVTELSEDQKHIIVFPATIPDLIRTIDTLGVTVKRSTRFAALDMFSVEELSKVSEHAMTDIIKTITVSKYVHEVMLFKITSLILGGEVHDLQVLLRAE